MFVENGRDRDYLNFIIKENKHQAPKTVNKDSNIVKLPCIPILPIIGSKIRKELWKTGCKVIFTSATKLTKILCNDKSKLLPKSYSGVKELCCDYEGKYVGETKRDVCSLDQWNTKKIASQENGKGRVQLNISKIVMSALIGCSQKRLQN